MGARAISEGQDRTALAAPATAARGTLRVVGPGRRERGYLAQLERLRRRAARLGGALEVSQRVERGCQRRLDRLEDELRDAHRAHKRLALALGALQRENELLRGRALEPGQRARRLARRPGS